MTADTPAPADATTTPRPRSAASAPVLLATSAALGAKEWLTSNHVDSLLHDLVAALLRDRPSNVSVYASTHFSLLSRHTEASPTPPVIEQIPTTTTTPTAATVRGEATVSTSGQHGDSQLASQQRDDDVSQESDDAHDGHGGAQVVDAYDDGSYNDEGSEERPTVEALLRDFPSPEASGVFPASLNKIGEGNYGYVLRGAAAIVANSPVTHNHEAITSETLPPSAASAPYAIKVVPVRANWTLDEAAAAQLITREVTALLQPKEQVASRPTTTCTHNHDAPNGIGMPDHHTADGAASQCGHCALVGARSVLRLEGPVCYDEPTDALWFPLTFAPITLDQCISERRQRYELQNLPRSSTAVPMYFTLLELRHVARTLLSALHFLGTICGVVHLDVKPCNVLLQEQWWPGARECDDAATVPQLFLGDLGLVQHIGHTKCQLGDFLYMAPEVYWPPPHSRGGDCEDDDSYTQSSDSQVQELNHKTTKRASVFSTTHDVWSVGVVLLHMMEGDAPFTSSERSRFEHMEDNYLAPAPKHTTAWPVGLIHFLACCFERDYDRRPTPHALLGHTFLQMEIGMDS